VKNEVSAGCDITELELALVLLNLLHARLTQKVVLFLQIGDYADIELVSRFLNLKSHQRGSRDLPLELLILDVSHDFIESCLDVNNPFRCQNDETWLCWAKPILFQQVRMELVAIVGRDLDLFLKELLPLEWHLPLDDMSDGERCLTIFADVGLLNLGVLQVSIFSIET
jgi:hypothetical protein